MTSYAAAHSPRETTHRALLLDVGIPLLVLAMTLGLLQTGEGDDRDLDALGILLAALAALPLLVRRRAPLPVFVFSTLASATLVGVGYPPGPPLGPTVALYEVAFRRDQVPVGPRLLGPVVALLLALHLAALGVGHDTFPGTEMLLGLALWGGVFAFGDRTRLRRERMAELEERAIRAEREAERERRLAAAEERTRIARDLHDSAGHAINVILVQAGAARLLSEKDPARARAALETIEEVARETVSEIDQLVRVMRDDADADDARDQVEPPPGLAALDGLAERHRVTGVEVTTTIRGSRRSLVPGVDQGAYRILQEALTNAARHGGGRVEVDVAFLPGDLELTVANPLRPDQHPAGSDSARGGHGIVGMRERAALLGGTLEVGAENGLFRVRARLPYRGNNI